MQTAAYSSPAQLFVGSVVVTGFKFARGRSNSMKPNLKPATRLLVTATFRFSVRGRKMASLCRVVKTSSYAVVRAVFDTMVDKARALVVKVVNDMVDIPEMAGASASELQ